MPKVPPRPINRHVERSISPNPDRFAPSPLNESPFLPKSPRNSRFIPSTGQSYTSDPIDRSKSVDLPSVGEEGMEYAAMAETLQAARAQDSSPEQTRSVGHDVKLHAPKPSLPAVNAKQRVAVVTRTDSDKAASFGIGRPSTDDPLPSNRSLKKKASTASQLSVSERDFEDEQGIPEIGQQVPLYPNAGDVQAHTPVPGSTGAAEAPKRHHKRKTSARGHPPGSYGLHGHGILPLDKLEKAYFEKHPEAAAKEHHVYGYDRPQDFSRSKEELNRIVRDTAQRGSGVGNSGAGTPSEQVGWQAIEQSTSRLNSPRLDPVGSNSAYRVTSPLQKNFNPEISISDADQGTVPPSKQDTTIHVEEPNRRRSVMFSDDEGAGSDQGSDHHYQAPILAADEVAKHPHSPDHQPAVDPPSERRGSAHEMEEPQSRPTSRPNSRPTSIYKEPSFEHRSTPLEDVDEYEPLFPEEEKKQAEKTAAVPRRPSDHKQRFPSRDIWEDAPNSVHYTAEVSTPDVSESVPPVLDIPARDGETPAQAFARHQEELAEKESRDSESFLHRKQKPQNWLHQKPHLAQELQSKRPGVQRFPSQDVWEDTPDSLRLETTVSAPQQDVDVSSPAETSPQVPQRPSRQSTDPSSATSDKPIVPERPKQKQISQEPDSAKPIMSERSKPQVPARPVKQGSGSEKDGEAVQARAKPAVPARPVGGKIAALQAGFMSDLNKRLQLGPQAPKKEEPAPEEAAEEVEKAPLTDARKGRARGPQRRAPRASPSPAAAASSEDAPTQKPTISLGFSTTTCWLNIDPDEDLIELSSSKALAGKTPEKIEEEDDEEDDETEEPEAVAVATNTAGETILETKIETDDQAKKPTPTQVEEVAKD